MRIAKTGRLPAMALAGCVMLAGCLAVQATDSSTYVESKRGYTRLDITLTYETEFEAPPALEALDERDLVLLDLRVPQDEVAFREAGDALYGGVPMDCGYGRLDGYDAVSVNTGSNHLLLGVELDGSAGTTLSCEYDLSLDRTMDEAPSMVRVRGCFLVSEFSIPTARSLWLQPVPGSACGLWD